MKPQFIFLSATMDIIETDISAQNAFARTCNLSVDCSNKRSTYYDFLLDPTNTLHEIYVNQTEKSGYRCILVSVKHKPFNGSQMHTLNKM